MKLLLSSFFAALTLAAIACSSSTGSTPTGSSGTSGSGTSGGTPASAADCASRCEAKFTMCGDAPANVKSDCSSQVCNASPTAAQLTCLEGKSCADIAGSMGFTSLCPGSASTSGGTSGTPAGVTCGNATCSATQYCRLSYDSSAMTWNAGSCATTPAACTSKGPADLCDCMQMNADCPTSGVISTKCSQSNGGLSFGCTN